MSIQTVSPVGATVAVPAVAGSGRNTGQPPASAASDGSVLTTISPWSKLLNRLEGLQATDPTAFKAAATKLGASVESARASATGTEGASLEKLGGALAQAAKTGDMAALKPALHHHHAHSAKHTNGGTGALLSNLLQEIDGIVGPSGLATTSSPTSGT